MQQLAGKEYCVLVIPTWYLACWKQTKIGSEQIYVKSRLRKTVVDPDPINLCTKSSALLKSEVQKHDLIFVSFLTQLLGILISKQQFSSLLLST